MTPKMIAEIHETLVQSNLKRVLLPERARKAALKQLLSAVQENEERIISALKTDLGRARFESYVAEIAFIKEEINLALRSLSRWCHKTHVKTPIVFQPGSSYVEPTPKGVVLILAPWNYPFQLSFVPLISAIAAGNCAIVKPSEIASASSEVIASIINSSLDTKCFRAICGDADIAKALLELPFDHIFYTGNTTVGSYVMEKAARHLTPVTLELGGKSPAIVDASCNLPLTVKRILWGKCLNAGQTCIAPDYVLIDNRLKDEFIKLAKVYLASMYGENAQDSNSLGRIINDHHFNRLQNYLKDGCIVHGGRHDKSKKYFEPTLITDVPLDSPLMTEEIFGPILPIIGINSIDDGIAFVASRPHPLALYIFATNDGVIRNVLEHTISGGVAINDVIAHVGIIDLPFGGIRHSGIGAYHGHHGFQTFSHMRAVHRRANMLDNPIKYAPYSDQKLRLAKIVM